METMGQKFRAAREGKGLDLSRAAALTRIKVQHLEMMEKDDFSRMPAPTYAKGFIRIYSELLDLDAAPLVQEYVDRHLNPPPPPGHKAEKNRREPPAARPPRPAQPARPPREPRKPLSAVLAPWLASLRAKVSFIVPHLPRVIGAVVLLVVVIGIGRCVSRLGSSSASTSAVAGKLDPGAIMKEPPVRYLELPAAGEEQP